MAILRPCPVSTRSITVDSASNLLVAEASTLMVRFERVWDDACDEGLTLISHRTNREVVYAVNHTERDAEGDILYWDLIPANTAEDFLPTLRIFND